MKQHNNTNAILLSMILLLAALPAPAADKITEAFDLEQKNIEGTTVYYQPVFADKMPFFEKTYTEFLAKVRTTEKISQNTDRILEKIDDIVGQSIEKEKLLKMFNDFQINYSPEGKTFYLMLRDPIKDYLRKGNTLPCFTYDAEEDMAEYQFQMIRFDEKNRNTDFELVFPIQSVEKFEADCNSIFELTTQVYGGTAWVGIHEVAEISLLYKIKPADPYWRWFSDGVANAVTLKILKECIGQKEAADFIDGYDLETYKDLKNQINLQYWMTMNYCIQTPFESQNNLKHARYAYATHEAQLLVDAHGWEKLKTIIDKASKSQNRNGTDLIGIIEEVTGYDMLPRFAQYQDFSTRQEGITKYVTAYSAAEKNKDYTAMIENILRVQELQDSQLNANGLMTWKNVAMFLARLGHEAAADQAMADCMELFAGTQNPDAVNAAREFFMMYAVQTMKPQKARKISQEVLEEHPENVWALTVKMMNLVQEGNNQAIEIAEKLQNLSQKGQIPHTLASQLLASRPK